MLVANRGEIAVRVIRACRDAGIQSVAIASTADADAKHARLADEVHSLAGNSPAETYLNQAAILAIARKSGVDAVHPGYGLLSENAEFAAAVEGEGLIWIGPKATVIAALGDKVKAREIAQAAGAPLLPASADGDLTVQTAEAFVAEHGLPVMIKAINGGGGRGMRIVREIAQIPQLLESAQREAGVAFGKPECFIERYAENARHVETQCLADRYGNVQVLSTRDCTLQRRQQKLIEEAPAPFLSAAQVSQLEEVSRAILKRVSYSGAATCEFLLTSEGQLSFLEVNTRVQVEHPVTEEVTGMDIIRAMIQIAIGGKISESPPVVRGHAIEFRINSEDLWEDFRPAPGNVTGLSLPGGPGVRNDIGYDLGDTVPPFYDSLFGKVIVRGETRAEAIDRARRALSEFAVSGIKTIAPLHRALLERPEFAAPSEENFVVHTKWIDENLPSLTREASGLLTTAPVATFASAPTQDESEEDGPEYRIGIPAPLSGLVLEWKIEIGDIVSPGDEIAVMEAMKMEQTIVAETSGVVAHFLVETGGFIDAEEDLIGLD